MAQPTLVMMAAGMGSRYGGLKQIDPVGPSGETLMDYSVYDAIRAGYGRLVFIIRRDIEQAFRQAIGRRFEQHIAVDYAFQELDDLPPGFAVPPTRQKPWGTAHAVLAVERIVGEPFVVLNADDFYGSASYRLLGEYLTSARVPTAADEYAMVGFRLGNTLSEHGHVNRAVCHVDAEGYLVKAVEVLKIEKDGASARYPGNDGGWLPLAADTVVSMNFWGLRPSAFGHLGRLFREFLERRGSDPKAEFFLPDALNALMAEGRVRVRVLNSPDSWFGITYREDKPCVEERVRELVARGVYPKNLWES